MNIQDLIIKDKDQVLLQDVFLSDENREQIETTKGEVDSRSKQRACRNTMN
mgnify:CR=1 FL=1